MNFKIGSLSQYLSISYKRQLFISFVFTALFFSLSCKKDDFLSIKPSSTLVVPTKLDEIRGLLDNESTFYETPLLGTQSADEYYYTYTNWLPSTPLNKNAYIWNPDVYSGDVLVSTPDWNKPFNQIFVANVAIEAARQISPNSNNTVELNNVLGTAYFLRAKAMFSLSEVFTLPYDDVTSESDLGLPIRLNSNVNDFVQRSSVKKTFDQILLDLMNAKDLLTDKTILLNRIRPTKLTAYAMLARVYLSIRKYDLAGKYADSALMAYSKLINYNNISSGSLFIFQNDETIYQNISQTGNFDFSRASNSTINLDTNLLKLYSVNDLRPSLYFRISGSVSGITGTYSGLIQFFSGLATDEVFLIRAECYARSGDLNKAASDLNSLLVNRFKTNTYTPVIFANQQNAIQLILQERRKELIFRGARWSDIRRLNKEGANIIVTRVLNGQTYTLPPNDKRFALYIPPLEIQLSGIQQNPR
jgi:hypothetical protein